MCVDDDQEMTVLICKQIIESVQTKQELAGALDG